jgi:PAS domain S-box-containing protein
LLAPTEINGFTQKHCWFKRLNLFRDYFAGNMPKFNNLWHQLTSPQAPDEDESIIEYITKAILVIFGGLSLVFSIPILIGWGFINFDPYTLLIIFFLDALLVSAYWISRHGYWRLASNVPPALFFLLGLSLSLNAGIVTTGLLFYFMAIVLAGFLVRDETQWLILILSVVTHLSVAAIRHRSTLDDIATIGIMISATFAAVFFLQRLFIRQFRRAIVRARSSEESMRSLFEGVPIGLYRTTPEADILDVNPALLDLLGYPDKETMLAANVEDIYVNLDDRKRFWEELRQNAEVHGFEMQLHRKDGAIIWVKDTVRAIKDANGKVLYAEGTLENISDLRKAEEHLIESEEKFRTLAEKNPNMIFINQGGHVVYANQACTETMGYSLEELYDPEFDFLTLLTPESRPVALENFRQHMGGQETEPSTYQLITKDGQILDAIHSTRLLNFGGKPAILGIITDITERVRAEKTMRHQLEELRILHAVANVGSEAVDEDRLIADVTRILGESFYPDHFGVLLLDEESASLRVHPSFRGIGKLDYNLKIPLGQGISGTVAVTGQPVCITDVTANPDFLHITPGISSELCVPMQVDGRIIGVVNAESRLANAFSPSDERFLVTASGQLATAIEKFRLLDTTRLRLERLLALRKIDQAITANLDLRPVLRILLDQVSSQLKVDASVIRLYSPATRELKVTAQLGLPSISARTANLPIGQGHAGLAALERRIVQVEDLKEFGQGFAVGELLGAEGFASYFAVPLVAKGQVKGVLELLQRSSFKPERDWLEFLDALATQAAIAIDNAELFEHLQKANFELTDAYDSTIEGWSRALDLRDKETEGHSQRVTDLTLRLARAMSVSEQELVHIRRGALLHDIGKMGIPDHILLKPGPLTDEEWEIMRQHPIYAFDLLSPVAHLKPAIDIPYSHHEKWDGTGYPLGLKGDQIPLTARIFALVDMWDALRSDRPYRPAWSDDEALKYIQSVAGSHLDPQVVQVFLTYFNSR